MTQMNPSRASLEAISVADLADYIEQRYHAALRRDVPNLIEAAQRVEQVHAGSPAVPTGLAELLADFWAEMERHMAKEERVLFPLLRRGVRGDGVAMPVRVMENEHEAHQDNLIAIRELTGNFVAPPQACSTWRNLYDGLAVLDAELRAHISLENEVLFPRATTRA